MRIFEKKCAYCKDKAIGKYLNAYGSITWVCKGHFKQMKKLAG